MTDQLYNVTVERRGYSYKTMGVIASSGNTAAEIALARASDEAFPESIFDYEACEIVLAPPPEPPMHETPLRHRFAMGDEVFVKGIGGVVSRQTINKIVITFFSGNLILEYGYFTQGQCVTYADNVFATAEEAFK